MPNTQAANIDTKANQTLENTSKTEVIVFDGKELKMTQTIKNDTIVVSISYDGETHTVVNDKTSLFLDGKKLNPLILIILFKRLCLYKYVLIQT